MSVRHFLFLVLLLVGAGPVPSAQHVLAQVDYQPPVMISEPALPQPPVEMVSSGTMVEPELAGSSATSNQMLWQQHQALQLGANYEDNSSRENCQTCSNNASSDYNRCGCSNELFPWNKGSGSLDRWCIGPQWGVEAGGLMMFRDDADWNRVITSLGGVTQPILTEQFEHGPGGRVFVTGYGDSGFGIQVGYEGINDWNSTLAFAPDAFAAGETREFNYQSQLNSVEVNFLPNLPSVWKLFSGFRYVQLDEDFLDSTSVTKTTPAPATPAVIAQFDDLGVNRLLKNRLFGFQFGGRRDGWQFGSRLTLQTFANAGVYCNKFRRDDVNLTVTTTIAGDDTATADAIEFTQSTATSQTSIRRDINRIAFVGEAGIAAAWRLNYCTALRAGYQILALDGVSNGLTASFSPGLSSDTLVFHGMQFGLEYRR